MGGAHRIRDTALAKAQEDVRRLESQNQRLSASSVDFADRLAATKADRDKISAASLQMGNAAKDKVTRLVKERDFYKSGLDTLQSLVAKECEAAASDQAIFSRIAADAKATRKELLDLHMQLDFESAATRQAKLEAANMRITLIEKENEIAQASRERVLTQESGATGTPPHQCRQ